MYITDMRVSALALFLSVTLVLAATHFASSRTDDCGACATIPTVVESVVPAAVDVDSDDPSDTDWAMS